MVTNPLFFEEKGESLEKTPQENDTKKKGKRKKRKGKEKVRKRKKEKGHRKGMQINTAV